MNCERCGRFLQKDETLLCERCYQQFTKWLSKRFSYLATRRHEKDGSPLELWLKKVKKNEHNN